jgi:hypothetical protein
MRVSTNGTWIGIGIIIFWWVKPQNKLICLKGEKFETGPKICTPIGKPQAKARIIPHLLQTLPL